MKQLSKIFYYKALAYIGMCVSSFTLSCLILWYSMDCDTPGSSVHGISQARILGWLPRSDEIHFDIWQNQYNIVEFKNTIKKNKNKNKTYRLNPPPKKKNIRVGNHFLLQGIFLTQELNPSLLQLLHWQ